MCGFAGFASARSFDGEAAVWLRAMNAPIAHRGPDAEGVWLDKEAGIALAHRRLAIIDVSEAGSQPMHSADGRYVIAYNGEIYNYRDLKRELDVAGLNPQWRGHSDTEVLLAAVCAWGVVEAVKRAKGMFAFALWDRRDRTITLARDRMGEKPLYFGWQGAGSSCVLLFGSDLAALTQHPAFDGELDRQAVEELVRYLYIPEPRSIYRGISKLLPGTVVTIDPASEARQTITYWDTVEEAAAARSDPFTGTPDEAVDVLAAVLSAAVDRQMVSDVPLGAFLSGGIDSSTIVALMQQLSARPVKTFTIGFGESEFDEAVHARAIAAHLGTDHTELILQPHDAVATIPALPQIYSEPFADPSQIPTYLVSRLAREQVTVSLSGDAGDELFGGYNRHVYAHRRWPQLERLPRALRNLSGRAMLSVPPSAWDRAARLFGGRRPRFAGDKLHKAGEALGSANDEDLYHRLVAVNSDSRDFFPEGGAPPVEADSRIRTWPASEKFMVLDAIGYLPGDILAKVDRASMAVSLESRIPMLDPDVMQFAWRLPIEFKIRDGISKWPLRQLLYRHVPRELVDRPKMGFTLPIDDWLRGPLRDWAEALLDGRRIEERGVFSSGPVKRLWDQHLQGGRNNGHRLWPILMANAWFETQSPNHELRSKAAVSF